MKGSRATRNGIASLACQVVDALLGFASRKVFIDCVGVALLGVNGTIASLLNTLSLAELGFETAVVTSLYKPIEQDDTDTIEDIVSILKTIYAVIGCVVILAGAIMGFYLPAIITGIDVDLTIYAAYALSLVGAAITYFLAYKKSFLVANHSNYVVNIRSTLCKIVATVVQIVLLIQYGNYVLFVGISILQSFITNLWISRYVDKHYSYNFNKKFNKTILDKLAVLVRDIFIGKVAGYVYSSTDNLIISAFASTVWVGLLGSYTQILYQLKYLVSNMFTAMRADVASKLSEADGTDRAFSILKEWTFVRYAITVMLFVPGYVLCDCFVAAWLGTDYVMHRVISLLIVTDAYISLVHGMLVDCIAVFQYFSYERSISIVGAIINIVVSITLVRSIGIVGVLIGTVVSQVFFWIARSILIFRNYFAKESGRLSGYWSLCILCTIVFYALCFVCRYFFDRIPLEESYAKFFLGGIICYLLILPSIIVIFGKTKEFVFLKNAAIGFLRRAW